MEEVCNSSSVECHGRYSNSHFLSTSALSLAIVVLTVGVYLAKKAAPKKGRRRKLPPHAPHVPVIGSIPFLDKKRPHITLTEWRQQHGDIYTMKVLLEPVVVINSAELIREALNTEAFAGRPYIYRINYGFHGATDVIFGTYTPKWQYMKKIAAKGWLISFF